MPLFEKIALLVVMALIVWFIYHTIRKVPAMFSKENISKSFYTMGILAIVLIGFIVLCIWLLRAGF